MAQEYIPINSYGEWIYSAIHIRHHINEFCTISREYRKQYNVQLRSMKASKPFCVIELHELQVLLRNDIDKLDQAEHHQDFQFVGLLKQVRPAIGISDWSDGLRMIHRLWEEANIKSA